MAPVLLTPLYAQLRQTGGQGLVETAISSVSFMTWVVTLPLFILLRGRFGGAPPIVAGRGRSDVMTSSIGEIMAYVSAVLIVMVVVWTLGAFLLAGVYTSLREAGHSDWMEPVSFAVLAASAVLVFPIFIALRGAMPGAAIPDVFD